MTIQITGDIPKHLMEEMQKDKPSNESSFWAKDNCKHCHGRGVIGTTRSKDKDGNVFVSDNLCICAHRSYKKWQEKWLEDRKSKKVSASNGDKKRELSEEERYKQVQSKLSRLCEVKSALESEIFGLDSKYFSLPHHAELVSIAEKINSEQAKINVAKCELTTAVDSLDVLKLAVRQLEGQVKDKKREVARREREVLPRLNKRLGEITTKIKSLDSDKVATEKALSRASHGIKKRKREAQKRLSRIQSRLFRVLKENKLESRISTNSTQLTDITEEITEERIDNQC
jgi:predicted  nucleic acid-binding Zn-ribbon protein